MNGPSPAFTLTDLAYETAYEVQAALDSGFVDGLATTTFSTPNLSEVGLTPLSPGDGTLGLRMTRPTSEGRVDGYLLQWKSGDEEYDDTDTSERQADVPGSGDREYTITGLDNGVEYTVRAMAYNDNGVGVPSDEVRGTPEAPPNSPARGAPTISGTAQVGETLTADTGGIEDDDGLADAVYSYQWLADDADIAGATKRHLHPGCRRRWQGHQGEGVVQRRQEPPGIPDQRGDGGGGGGPRRSDRAAECSPDGAHRGRHQHQPDVDLGRP